MFSCSFSDISIDPLSPRLTSIRGFILYQRLSTRNNSVPQGTFDNVQAHFWLCKLEVGSLLTASGQRPGILLNLLQCTGYPLRTNNYLVQNFSSADVWKPCLRLCNIIHRSQTFCLIFISLFFSCISVSIVSIDLSSILPICSSSVFSLLLSPSNHCLSFILYFLFLLFFFLSVHVCAKIHLFSHVGYLFHQKHQHLYHNYFKVSFSYFQHPAHLQFCSTDCLCVDHRSHFPVSLNVFNLFDCMTEILHSTVRENYVLNICSQKLACIFFSQAARVQAESI